MIVYRTENKTIESKFIHSIEFLELESYRKFQMNQS